MSMFSEDPTLPVAALLLTAACCFVALKSRQEAKYLIWGGAALALAAGVAAVEWFWVTDEERIEGVVYDVRKALLTSDAPAILAHMTDDVQYVQAETSIPSAATRAMISGAVSGAKFDMIRIREFQASAGRQTRRGKAEFKVFAKGTISGPMGFGGLAGADDSMWSLGFEETKPGVWKINRITPIGSRFNPAQLAGGEGFPRPDVPSPRMDLSLPPAAPNVGPEPLLPKHLRPTRKSLYEEQIRRRDRMHHGR